MMAAYSFAKQVIKVSEAEDQIIKDWFKSIVKRNEHLMYEYSNYKSGSGASGSPKRAHNHALSSAMSHMQLGILLSDNKLFRKAFKNFESAIKYQRKDAVLGIIHCNQPVFAIDSKILHIAFACIACKSSVFITFESSVKLI